MQVAADILRFLFFPGLLFVALCGFIIALVEARVRTVLYGGEAPAPRSFLRGGGEVELPSLAGIIVLLASLTCVASTGFLLVGVKGDLLLVALLFGALELLPLFYDVGGKGGSPAYAPLHFRVAAFRVMTVFCVVLAASLRLPGEFAPALHTLENEGAFGAIQIWSGVDFALMLASMVLGAVALLIYTHALPSWMADHRRGQRGAPAGVLYVAAGWGGRAAAVTLFSVVFLGYPWPGVRGALAWSAAVLGIVAFVIAAGAWATGRCRATRRRWQEMGMIFALLALALALAAAW
ncbi:MAG: hypothetical protein SWK76_10425 [Actinomycetota bacterium]|nr:hypothetical protein [Actinomycetota bacterium]